MNKIKVLQQVINPVGIGGVTAEYQSLINSDISREYEFIPMVLPKCHNGISIADIKFYLKKIKESKPDIIHIRGAAPDGLNAVIAAKIYGKAKILVTVHGMYSDLVYISGFKRWICKHVIERLIFSLSDGISCVCKSASERAIFKRYKKKMLPFVYNRMPVYSFEEYNETRDVVRTSLNIHQNACVGVYVGRITREKGIEYLLSALSKLDKEWIPNSYILMVGDGDYLKEFVKAVSVFQHKNNVIVVGSKSNVRDYLFASDFFIQPSLHENHSIALLEAMAAHLPAIATDVGGNSEIVKENVFGELVRPFNYFTIYESLKNFFSDINMLRRYKENIVKYNFLCFKDENINKQLESVYNNILKNNRGK